MTEPRCGCGHLSSDHRRPFRLIAWLWRFDYLWLFRPCGGVFHKSGEHVKCACRAYRPKRHAD